MPASPPLTRAYAVLHVKSIEPEARTIKGIASTPEADRMGDVVESLGITFKNPVPLLLHHNTQKPVGRVWFDAPTAEGLTFTAELPEVTEAGTLRDRVNEAWQSLKTGLLGGVSIGFRSLEESFDKTTKGFRFLKTEVLELSLVTVPANAGATVHTIKQLDRAATGPEPIPATRDRSVVHAQKRRAPMENLQVNEQISAFEATRTTKSGRMVALMSAAAAENVTLDETQRTEYDGLRDEIKGIDDHLARLREMESLNIASATRVEPRAVVTSQAASAARGASPIVQVRSVLPQGTAFVRAICAKIICKGNMLEASEYAQRWKDSTPEVAAVLKAAIAAGSATDATWAAPLVNQKIAADFIALLRPATILGKIPGLRQVPFNTKVPQQTGGGTYGWVGEGAPKPLTKLAFGSVSLGMAKAAGIIVITEELARLSSPSAEAVVRDDMIAGISAFLDVQFTDPAIAEVVGVHPASVTNGAPTSASGGNPAADVVTILKALAAANQSVAGVTLIMSETNALVVGLMRDANGNQVFPGMGPSGGNALGVNIVTSNAVGANVIGLQPSRILYADDGGIEIDVSREASLQMSDAPDNPVVATTLLVSLWQNNLVGLRAERFINWKRIDAASVYVVSAANYAPSIVSPSMTGAALGGSTPVGATTDAAHHGKQPPSAK